MSDKPKVPDLKGLANRTRALLDKGWEVEDIVSEWEDAVAKLAAIVAAWDRYDAAIQAATDFNEGVESRSALRSAIEAARLKA
jgi:hypothetical protein